MKFDITIALYIAFTSQVITGSWLLPKSFILPLFRNRSRQIHTVYKAANTLTGVIGIGLLATLITSNYFDSITKTLIGIGSFFLIQLVPLAIVAKAGILSQNHTTHKAKTLKDAKFGLSSFVHPALITTAGILAIGYFSMGIFFWNAHPLQLVIFVAFNFLLAITITFYLRQLTRTEDPQILQKLSEAHRVIPVMVFLSIFITVYYTFKHGLFSMGLHEIRPIMMSAFIQILNTALFIQIKRHISIGYTNQSVTSEKLTPV